MGNRALFPNPQIRSRKRVVFSRVGEQRIRGPEVRFELGAEPGIDRGEFLADVPHQAAVQAFGIAGIVIPFQVTESWPV
jgi:hypothetical protein